MILLSSETEVLWNPCQGFGRVITLFNQGLIQIVADIEKFSTVAMDIRFHFYPV